MKIPRKISVLYLRAIPKTVFFNLRYFPLRDAIKFPIIVSHRVKLLDIDGEIEILGEKRFGMITIGFGNVSIFDAAKSRSIWQVSGKVTFEGSAHIGHGSKISVGTNGRLIFGDGFIATAEFSMVCQKGIRFGKNCLIGFETLFMDSDAHKVFDQHGNILNEDEEIVIGNHVWIGCRCLLLKGAHIPDDCVVGANTLVSDGFDNSNQIIAGNPARTIKKNITWQF